MNLSRPFKAHCSAIGKILSDPQGKTAKELYLDHIAKVASSKERYASIKNLETKTAIDLREKILFWETQTPLLEANQGRIQLSKTCLGEVHAWMKSLPEFYGRRKGFKSKYTDKGNECEAGSIEYASSHYGWGMVAKNEETKSNDYLIGTADVILAKSVEDIKNSWSEDTFPLFHTEIPIDGYGWQGQGYMELYDKEEFGLVYTLMDSPEHMVEREARHKAWDLGMDDVPADLYDEIKEQMSYSNFADELRIKRFVLKRDRDLMGIVQDRVELINKYINNI